jgi:hypothetical protein
MSVRMNPREPGVVRLPMTKTVKEMPVNLEAARVISPEDLHVGDYVSILRAAREFPALFTCHESVCDPERNYRITWIPTDPHPPYRVSQLCLPFILVKTYDRKPLQLDVRTVQLGRLTPEYGRCVRRVFRRQDQSNRKIPICL